MVQAAAFEDMKGRASELAAEASHDGFYNDREFSLEHPACWSPPTVPSQY